MAGGGGTRLWPVSRKERPKQLLPLLDDKTLFQSTVARLEKLFPPHRILVVTVAEQARIMQEQAPDALRGRVMSFYSFSFMGAGPVGALFSGYLVKAP